MKFRYKIFLAYLILFVLVFSSVAVLVTQTSYDSMRKNEIERSINDFNGIGYMVTL